MKRVIVTSLFLYLSIYAKWKNPTPVCTAAGTQENFLALPYADSGVLVLWEDGRNGNVDIYAQALDADGNALWQKDGIPVIVQPGNQTQLDAVVLESGDVVVAWDDDRNGNHDIFSQRLSSNGTLKWNAGGVPVCVSTGDQYTPFVCQSADGTIITWADYRNYEPNGYTEIRARRINTAGIPQWPDSGIIIQDQYATIGMTSPDFKGGTIISWGLTDWKTSIASFWAQRVDSLGNFQWGDSGISLYSFHFSSYMNQRVPSFALILSDSSGGAILQWREPVWRVQRVDSAGTKLWNDSGVVIASIVSDVPGASCSDGQGGIITAWGLGYFPPTVKGNRVDSSGTILWGDGGKTLWARPGPNTNGVYVRITPNPGDGLVMTYYDPPDDYHPDAQYRAQRINGDGDPVWHDTGVVLDNVILPEIVSDARGGGICVWSSSGDIYALHVDSTGNVSAVEEKFTPQSPVELEISSRIASGNVVLRYSLSRGEPGYLKLFDASGRMVESFPVQGQGEVKVVGLSTGVYFCQLEGEGTSVTRKVVVVK